MSLSGIIDKIVYTSSENGFTVARLKVNARETVTVRGSFLNMHAGQQVTFSGRWVRHPKFGSQFEAETCSIKLPSSAYGIRKYLSSGLVKGIGPKYAEKLVERFGGQTLEIIDKDPQKLFEVSGLGSKRVAAIIEAWREQKEISRVMVFLQEKGIPVDFSVKIFKTYGQESIARIQENPYRLAEDIWGIGFKSADKVALKLGFANDSIYRVSAAILHVINEGGSNGHLYVPLEEVRVHVPKLLEMDEQALAVQIKTALHALYEREKIKLITHQNRHYLSLPQYYFSEKGIATKLRRLKATPTALHDRFDYNAIYQELRVPDQKGFALNEEQQAGIMTCLQQKITIITGGPGTGKTTLIKKLLAILQQARVRFRLAAPTGRAAKRMYESTGHSAETLHRLLAFSPASMNFTKNEHDALALEVLIIDEASMIDVFLMHAILRALPQHAQLLLIGDVDQLPSVGAGDVLRDLIASEYVAVVRLKHIFRQAQDSLIIVNAHRINHGEFPTSSLPEAKNDFKFFKEDNPENVFSLLRKLYTSRLQQYGIKPTESVVLCPMNRGIVGTLRLNQELQTIINPLIDEQKQMMRFGRIYKVNDRVMQIRNNYDKFVFNGDMGTIVSINKEDQQMMVRFGSRILSYDFLELNELVLSYAISIHKSQGSEFRAVIVPIFMQHFIMLQRNLIYTAITRAKELCIFIGQPKAIAMAIKNNKGAARYTFLQEFLTTDLEAR